MKRVIMFFFFFSSRRRHTRWTGDWSSDVCSSDLEGVAEHVRAHLRSAQSRGGGERLEFAGKVLAREVAGLTERGEKPSCLPVTTGTGQEREVLAHGLLGRFVERHEALLVALAAHGKHAGVALGR